MRVKRKSQVEAYRRAAKEEAAWMEAEKLAAAMKAEIQATAVELAFQISVLWILGYWDTHFIYLRVTIVTFFLIICFCAPCCLLAHAITLVFNIKTGYFGNPKPSTDLARRIPLL